MIVGQSAMDLAHWRVENEREKKLRKRKIMQIAMNGISSKIVSILLFFFSFRSSETSDSLFLFMLALNNFSQVIFHLVLLCKERRRSKKKN